MSTNRLIQILKQQLKARGMNYRKLAAQLSLSESGVKRMFASGNMSLRRLDQVCEALSLDFFDLLRLFEAEQVRLDGLSEHDEQKLVDNPKLLLVAYCLVNGWEVQDIVHRYTFTETELVPLLAELDRIKLIELQPGNRVKRLLANNFKWQTNGPIERFFRAQVQQEFFSSTFSGEGDLHLVKNADITPAAMARLSDRLTTMGRLFDDITRDERTIAHKERRGTTMVLAIRHWQYKAFRRFER